MYIVTIRKNNFSNITNEEVEYIYVYIYTYNMYYSTTIKKLEKPSSYKK